MSSKLALDRNALELTRLHIVTLQKIQSGEMTLDQWAWLIGHQYGIEGNTFGHTCTEILVSLQIMTLQQVATEELSLEEWGEFLRLTFIGREALIGTFKARKPKLLSHS